MNKKIILLLGIIILGCSGCSLIQGKEADQSISENKASESTEYMAATVGNYDSADTAVLVSINKEDNTITFLNRQVGKKYTLHYDGATTLLDKYNQSVSMAQMEEGNIVSITFMKNQKRLNSMAVSDKAWEYGEVSKFEFKNANQEMTIISDSYELDDHVVVISDGKQVELMDVNACDVLTVCGMDKTIYSIIVDKGHGYLRLTNDEYFIGGWIEVGQALIQTISEDMLLVVPEGTYQVLLSNDGSEGTKEVTILRDGEVELDVGDLKGEAKFGDILFSVTPANASFYIDGELVDVSEKINLEYGIHQMIVKADGYNTITQYIKVGQAAANINIVMEDATAAKSTSSNGVSSNTVQTPAVTTAPVATSANTAPVATTSGNTVATAVDSSSYHVYLDSPEGAEVYLDGNYLGIAPLNFKKTVGSHVITLRKTGYQTKSYTVALDNEDKNITYSFSNLIAN